MSEVRFEDVGARRRTPKAALSIEELGQFIEATKGEEPDVRVMRMVGMTTGMRFSENSALEWQDVDFSKS